MENNGGNNLFDIYIWYFVRDFIDFFESLGKILE